MENKQPLLSICIPTYNRAEYLKEALVNITSDSSFDERIEIVISDNASTDNTSIIVDCFCKTFQTVKYYKNDTNIKDFNFYLALSRGTGKYVRLFNDTLRLKEGALENILHKISVSCENIPLFFYQNINVLGRVDSNYTGNNVNSFIEHVSYYSTWIANLGCWKHNIDQIISPNQFSKLQLSQVDWTLQIIDREKQYMVSFGDYFDSIPLHKKGGYNIFKVFVSNYLFIVKRYNWDFKYRIIEKNRLLRYFVMPWMWTLYKDKDNYSFITDNKWGILLKHYYFYPSFYYEIFKYLAKKMLFMCKRLISRFG